MKRKYLMGFDVGTSESKGTLCDLDGRVLVTAAVKHGIRSPQPGFAEHDPIQDWIGDLRKIVKALLGKGCAAADEIEAIGISTIMAAITAVDENCEPLRNAILYGIDTRCVPQVEELNRKIGAETLQKKFGGPLSVEHFGPKILWIRENEPEVFQCAKHFTFASGFLTARLTGNFYVDPYSASSALPMFDPLTTAWDPEMCRLICREEQLPRIASGTYASVGCVSAKAAAETGLAEGTKVICGTTDAGAEAVSAGVVKPGDTMLMYGSTSFYIGVTDHYLTDTSLWCNHYTIDGIYSCTGGMATTGSLTKWIRDEMAKDLLAGEAQGGENAYTSLFREAESIPVGSDGLICLPYFMGERMPIQDPLAKGVFFGLNLRHQRGHLVRAAMEGVGYGIAQNMDLLRSAGLSLDHVTAVGGGTRSRLWLQIVSDICGIAQRVPAITVGASYGDALMAGLAVGSIPGPDSIGRLIQIQDVIQPDWDRHKRYQKYLKIYSDLYQRNSDLMHQLW